MLRTRRLLATGALAALAAAGTVVASTAPASAYVVCNRWGNCWHTYRPYYYDYDDDYYGPYNGSYYGSDYYGPGYYGGYYGPSVSLGFLFGNGGWGGYHHHGHDDWHHGHWGGGHRGGGDWGHRHH